MFKVATARSVKLKAKAQKVMTNLKKLDVKATKTASKDKVAEIDRQLQNIRKEAGKSKPKPTKSIIKPAKLGKKANKKSQKNSAPVQTNTATNLVEKMQI